MNGRPAPGPPSRPAPVGTVYLVGAGPGDPKLITLRAVEVLAQCDVVLVDQLVNRAILAHARQGARVLDVGKRAGNHAVRQEEICELLVAYARRGRTVVRLKGGDPFVFGRGGEEALALVAAGVPWEVVPGISAGIAAAAYAGIPLTHRGISASVSFHTAHRAERDQRGQRGKQDPPDDDAPEDGTMVFFMCGATLEATARDLVESGRSPGTPIAIVRSGTREDQEVFIGTLADVLAGPLAIESPALAVVGEVVALEAKLRWFGARRSRPIRPRRLGANETEECTILLDAMRVGS